MYYFTPMKPLSLVILITLSATAFAQDKKLLFYDSDWKPSTTKTYAFIVEQKKINDTCWEWNYYTATQPRFISIQFKSQQGGTVHGRYIVYTHDGYVDTSGYYYDGKRNGEWTVRASNHHVLRKLEYKDDVLMSVKDSNEVKKEWERWNDSLKKLRTDTLEIESEFPGGNGSWIQYLSNNLKYPKPSYDSNSQGVVHVIFIVDTDGRVTDVDIDKSAEYYIDQEALRLIRSSPKWKPAVQDGKKVKSYKKQPIDFHLSWE